MVKVLTSYAEKKIIEKALEIAINYESINIEHLIKVLEDWSIENV